MALIEVDTPALAREFILFQVRMYKDDPNYIRPLDKDIDDTFDPKVNRTYRSKGSEAIRWLLTDDSGQTIGRIAAFINTRTSETYDQPTGGIGFFDCINDQKAADTLFDAARVWLSQRGMEAMDGPINFGERDKFWGLLIDGYEQQNYGMHYNFPYYRTLFENYGFRLFFNQYTYGRPVLDPATADMDKRMYERSANALKNPDISFRYIPKKEFNKAPEYFLHVYNKAWGHHKGVKPMNLEQAKKMFQKLAPIADERLIWFGFYKDEPIAFYISIPELNQLFKYVNGRLDLIGKIKLVWHKWRGSCTKMLGIVFGVVPEWHGKGVESAIVVEFSKLAWGKNFQYTMVEMNWIGDFNPKMMKVCEQIGARIVRTHATYRYLFDREKEFKREEIIA